MYAVYKQTESGQIAVYCFFKLALYSRIIVVSSLTISENSIRFNVNSTLRWKKY